MREDKKEAVMFFVFYALALVQLFDMIFWVTDRI